MFRASFKIDGDRLKQGFLAPARDDHGFSYGVAVAQVDNVMIHIRFATISTLTAKELSNDLDRAWSAAEQGRSVAG